MRIGTRFLLVLSLALLSGCAARPASTAKVSTNLPSSLASLITRPDLTIHGTVDLALFTRLVQSDQSNLGSYVAIGATVSLIRTSDNVTVGATVTDAGGHFKIAQFQSTGVSFAPTTGTSYYLEAFRGLGNGLPSNSVIRVRTLIEWTAGGWTSLTGPNISISKGTTALAAMFALKHAVDPNLDPSGLMGSLSTGSYADHPNFPAADFTTSLSIVTTNLQNGQDPVLGIGISGSQFISAAPGSGGGGGGIGLTINPTPATASIGDALSITGSGFDTAQATAAVFFPIPTAIGAPLGTQSVATIISTTQLSLAVPVGAHSGNLGIQMGPAVFFGSYLTIYPRITGLSAAGPFHPGDLLMINGSGFTAPDPVHYTDANRVIFGNNSGGSTAIPSYGSSTETQLTVTVPYDAVTGPVAVFNGDGGSATWSAGITVTPNAPWISSLTNPSSYQSLYSSSPVYPGQQITISCGSCRATGSVSITPDGTSYYPCPVAGANWNPNGLTSAVTFTAPSGLTPGIYGVQMTTDGGSSDHSHQFTLMAPFHGRVTFDPSGQLQPSYFWIPEAKLSGGQGVIHTIQNGGGANWVSIPSDCGNPSTQHVSGALGGMTFDVNGHVYLADANGTVYRMSNYQGCLDTIASGVLPSTSDGYGYDLAFDTQGNLYALGTVSGASGLYRFAAAALPTGISAGPAATVISWLPMVCRSIDIDDNNNVFTASADQGNVYKVVPGIDLNHSSYSPIAGTVVPSGSAPYGTWGVAIGPDNAPAAAAGKIFVLGRYDGSLWVANLAGGPLTLTGNNLATAGQVAGASDLTNYPYYPQPYVKRWNSQPEMRGLSSFDQYFSLYAAIWPPNERTYLSSPPNTETDMNRNTTFASIGLNSSPLNWSLVSYSFYPDWSLSGAYIAAEALW